MLAKVGSLEGRALSRPKIWDMTAHVPPAIANRRVSRISQNKNRR
jgi:hypothetical protein